MKLRKVYEKAKNESIFSPDHVGPGNIHKFPFHGKFTQMGGKPVNTPNEKEQDPKGDIAAALVSIEDANDEIEGLPETLSLVEFFKFSQSGLDNTSLKGPSRGAGSTMPSKGLHDFSSTDPSLNTTKNKKRFQTLRGRDHQRPKPVEKMVKKLSLAQLINGGIGVDIDDELEEHLQEMNYRNAGLPGDNKTTKQPYSQGVPGRDKKDIAYGYEKIDELTELNRKEEERKQLLKKQEEEELSEARATSSFNRLMGQKTMHQPKSDLDFWEISNKDNVYITTKQVDSEKKPKHKNKRKK